MLSENRLTEDLLRQQIAAGEGERIEFKLEAQPELVGSTIAAFLNARGGTLVVGVDDAGNAVGTSPSAANSVKEVLARGIVPYAPISVEEVLYEGKLIVVVSVPAGSDGPYLFGDQIFVRSGAQTRLVTQMPVVREALVNALVHRDYAAFDGSVSITLFPERMEIWNPGSLPAGMTLADLEAGGASRLHNPDIANVFLLRGLIERAGTAYDPGMHCGGIARTGLDDVRRRHPPDPASGSAAPASEASAQ